MKEEGDQLRTDYTSKQLEDLRMKYQAIVSEASSFMVSHRKSGTYDESSPGLKMPAHLLTEGEGDEKLSACTHVP